MRLIQILEEGFDNGAGVDDDQWRRVYRRADHAVNRRRILDREQKAGNQTRADGWLYMRRDHGDFVHVQRVRWIDAKWVQS
ncbi:hypothetical protein [Gordonia tangerina]|uniref:Uncharacterized protein n=1 Tax=Gordonia tangerina TaxID=2911060 RepID=A0ABS9DMX9_9ACTN|nr:hypothetical protein [Gordonia tangerina]MCF3939952.1 hypothetical protein [Gordonia tangerina]